jgi:hypothetical protein
LAFNFSVILTPIPENFNYLNLILLIQNKLASLPSTLGNNSAKELESLVIAGQLCLWSSAGTNSSNERSTGRLSRSQLTQPVSNDCTAKLRSVLSTAIVPPETEGRCICASVKGISAGEF